MAKSIIVSGYYGFDNFGDDAILGVIVDKLKSLGNNIAVISKNPKKTSLLYQVYSVKNFSLLSLFLAMSRSDVLISGGGSLLQDVTSFKSLLYYSAIIWLAEAMNKKVIIFAQGIGPLNREKSVEIVKKLLLKADFVSVRDQKSLQLLNSWGVKATLVNDPVFSLEVTPANPDGTIGVQLRDYKTMNDVLLNRLAEQILKEFPGRKIEIYAFQKALDYKICLKFEKILKTMNPEVNTEVIHSLTKNDFIFKMSHLEYMIAMRFHAVLVALKLGIKTIAINYDAKVTKLAYEALIPIITMKGDDDYDAAFAKMKALDSRKLLHFANTKPFNWSGIMPFIS